jgi:hypothetical protein
MWMAKLIVPKKSPFHTKQPVSFSCMKKIKDLQVAGAESKEKDTEIVSSTESYVMIRFRIINMVSRFKTAKISLEEATSLLEF